MRIEALEFRRVSTTVDIGDRYENMLRQFVKERKLN
jgi:hypothetical protein